MPLTQWLILGQVCVTGFLVSMFRAFLTSMLLMTSEKAYELQQRFDAWYTTMHSGFYTQANQGGVSETDADPHNSAAGATYDQAYTQANTNRINDLIDAHNSLCNGSVTSLVNRVNALQNMLRSAGMMG